MNAACYGLVARFSSPEQFLDALRRVREAGFTRIETYAPFPVEDMTELLPGKPAFIHWIVFAAALLGASGGYFMQWFATHDYPINVGGRPLHSWPAFVPVTFELTVLTAGIVGLIALFFILRLPRLHHPIFSAAEFRRASQDRFFLCIRADDPHFEPRAVRQLLDESQPEFIEEVAA